MSCLHVSFVCCCFVCTYNIHFQELQQIEDEFVRLCGSSSAMMNAEQFSSLLSQLGFIPTLCKQCFKYVWSFWCQLVVVTAAHCIPHTVPWKQIPRCLVWVCVNCRLVCAAWTRPLFMADSVHSFAASSYSTSTVLGGSTCILMISSMFTEHTTGALKLMALIISLTAKKRVLGRPFKTAIPFHYRQMVKDICTFKKIFLEEKELEKSAEDNWRYEQKHFGTSDHNYYFIFILHRIFCADQKQGISLDLFLSVVGQLKFRGTSVLFRLPHPPVKRLNIECTVNALPYSPKVSRENQKGNICYNGGSFWYW